MQFRQIFALVGIFAITSPAQQTDPQKAALVAQAKDTLKLTVIEGEGAKNNVASRSAVAPVVEVKDASDKPVVGAEVVFQLPMVGPSGNFNGWLKTQTVRTNERGQASVTGYAPNSEAGRFNIKVTATMGNQTGSVIIAQSNIAGNGGSGGGGMIGKKSNALKYLIGIGGTAAALGVVAAVVGGDNGTAAAAATPVSVTPGAVAVGAPR